ATRRRSLRPLHSFPTRRSSDLARDVDVLATPATLGEAPDISDTGSNIFIRIWTLLHNPSLTLPIARGPRGLPVGLQLVGFQKERSEEHTSELQSRENLVCRLLL